MITTVPAVTVGAVTVIGLTVLPVSLVEVVAVPVPAVGTDASVSFLVLNVPRVAVPVTHMDRYFESGLSVQINF